jgi:HlyD family secretion protein
MAASQPKRKEDKMKIKWLFLLSAAGLLGACYVAYFATITRAAQPPLFNPAANPYADGIYAEGMVESTQSSGENINMYPEVAGTVKQIFAREGQSVKKGDALLEIDESIQRATVEQQLSQAQAARAMLEELKAEPRKETLDVTVAQVNSAEASLKTATDALDKQEAAYKIDPGSISKDALDSAVNAKAVALKNLDVAKRQYDLTKAGAWVYDINNQQKQYEALLKAYAASSSLLGKYILHAPRDGVVLTLNTVVGAYVSPLGAYDTYTQASDPVLTFGSSGAHLNVRCYVDEILVSRLPQSSQIQATMTIRGTTTTIPLTFDRIQPFVSPKIELSDQRQELVDVRVLPIIFQLDRPKNVNLYPGELVDVYIGH